jgi:hypothetical protein
LGFGEFAAGINERRDGGIPHNSIARGRSSICHGRATSRSVLNFSDSIMIAAENSPIPALHIDTVASGTGSSNPACSSGESGTNLVIGSTQGPVTSLRIARAHLSADSARCPEAAERAYFKDLVSLGSRSAR